MYFKLLKKSTKRVLLLEEDFDTITKVQASIKILGNYQVYVADTPKDLLDILGLKRIDLLIVGLDHPAGIATVYQAQNNLGKKMPPIIYLTSEMSSRKRKIANPTSPAGYLSKSFKIKDLASILREKSLPAS